MQKQTKRWGAGQISWPLRDPRKEVFWPLQSVYSFLYLQVFYCSLSLVACKPRDGRFQCVHNELNFKWKAVIFSPLWTLASRLTRQHHDILHYTQICSHFSRECCFHPEHIHEQIYIKYIYVTLSVKTQLKSFFDMYCITLSYILWNYILGMFNIDWVKSCQRLKS